MYWFLVLSMDMHLRHKLEGSYIRSLCLRYSTYCVIYYVKASLMFRVWVPSRVPPTALSYSRLQYYLHCICLKILGTKETVTQKHTYVE
jgi:hypothetical protein